MTHQLVDSTLYVERDSDGKALGIVAQCTCGWRSRHFTSFSASAAFQEHKEQAAKTEAK
jgi:hypothetical protein